MGLLFIVWLCKFALPFDYFYNKKYKVKFYWIIYKSKYRSLIEDFRKQYYEVNNNLFLMLFLFFVMFYIISVPILQTFW